MVGGWHGVADGISIAAGVGFSPHSFCINSGCPVCFPSPYTPTTRDSDWIARELGDVEYRVGTFQGIQVECGPNFAPPSPAYRDGPVPVESLGRDQGAR